MLYTLENSTVKITVDSLGAELKSITGKEKNTEFLWNSDPKYWHSSAPVLFPIIGELWNHTARIDGKEYTMVRHGILRPQEFTLIAQTKDELVFEFSYDENTLKLYPYKFIFQMIYSIDNQSVRIGSKVKNVDNKVILFNIGTHPAFMCPINKEEKLEDYSFTFDKSETCSVAYLNDEGYYPKEKTSFMANTDTIHLSKELFMHNCFVFDNLNSSKITLSSEKSSAALTVDFSGFPNLVLWQPKDGAPFVCIEPWYGHSDYVGFDGEFCEKKEIIKLSQGNVFECNYTVKFKE